MTLNQFFLQAYLSALSGNPIGRVSGTESERQIEFEYHAEKCADIASAATNRARELGLFKKIN